MDNDFAPMVVMWSLSALTGWIIWVISTNRRRRETAKQQAEMQAKILDKMSGNQDLTEYLKTDAGQRLLLSVPAEPARNPFTRILFSIQAGLILALLGVALLLVSGRLEDAEKGTMVLGTMSLAIGLGFLISAVISYTLSKSWGLLNGNKPPQP